MGYKAWVYFQNKMGNLLLNPFSAIKLPLGYQLGSAIPVCVLPLFVHPLLLSPISFPSVHFFDIFFEPAL